MFTLYSADFTGNPGNCSYPHKTVVMNTDNLRLSAMTMFAPNTRTTTATVKTSSPPTACPLTVITITRKIRRIGSRLPMCWRHFPA